MVVYAYNHIRDTYKLHNTETKMVFMSRDIKWAEWKTTDPAETMKTFRNSNEDGLVPGMYEDKTLTSDPEDKLSDEGEIARTNEKTNLSELTYPKKETEKFTSAYDRVLNSLKN